MSFTSPAMASSRPAGPTDRFLVGPHLQIWWTGRVWSGIGPVGGVIVSRYTNTGLIGAELRAGFAFPLRGRSTISPLTRGHADRGYRSWPVRHDGARVRAELPV